MPTYQYACTECHDQFELVQKFTDDALTECPHCGGKVRKVFSAVGVVFKGSGFYRNDSRSPGSSSSSGSGGSTSTPAPASSDGGSSSGSSTGTSTPSTPSTPAAKPSTPASGS